MKLLKTIGILYLVLIAAFLPVYVFTSLFQGSWDPFCWDEDIRKALNAVFISSVAILAAVKSIHWIFTDGTDNYT